MMQNGNLGMPYPIYPPYQGIPNMINPIPSPTIDCSNNSDMNNIEKRIDNLEKRISSIENYINNSNSINTNYNSSNYQML